ncbi:hypothetical protein I4Q42_22895 [Caulobacter hibisci]|uniref:Uncharacterized protein n=2 Tax=Caulobacter hibisci TaxID=2035993 RepID=A0ABS0T3T0_9CAUL|nr:hypothetical protein [Caulobacter hibisci]
MAATLVAVAALGAAQVAAATPSDLFYERSLMSAAGARCGLFTPSLSGALDAGRAQARGAALRAGASVEQLDGVQQRAHAKAASVPCASKDLTTAAGRVRKAFEGYALLQRMDYPGDRATWQADRASSATIPFWRLSQPSAFGPDRLMFGLAGRNVELLAVATFADGARPYAARLVMRDPTRTQGPYLKARNGGGLADNAAPRAASRVFGAETRDAVPAPTLLPTGAKTGMAFRFPREAGDVIARLDPREAITVEFLIQGRDGDVVRRAYVEVGDFAAGRAFLRVS